MESCSAGSEECSASDRNIFVGCDVNSDSDVDSDSESDAEGLCEEIVEIEEEREVVLVARENVRVHSNVLS